MARRSPPKRKTAEESGQSGLVIETSKTKERSEKKSRTEAGVASQSAKALDTQKGMANDEPSAPASPKSSCGSSADGGRPDVYSSSGVLGDQGEWQIEPPYLVRDGSLQYEAHVNAYGEWL